MKKKKKKEEDKPLKHITVHLDEGKPVKYANPTNCTVNGDSGLLNIQDIIYTPSINYFRDRDNPVVDERGRLDGLDSSDWYAKKLAEEKEREEKRKKLLEAWNEYFEEHNKEYPAPHFISLTEYLEFEADFKFREYLKDNNITVEQINDILVLHWDDSFKFSNEGEPWVEIDLEDLLSWSDGETSIDRGNLEPDYYLTHNVLQPNIYFTAKLNGSKKDFKTTYEADWDYQPSSSIDTSKWFKKISKRIAKSEKQRFKRIKKVSRKLPKDLQEIERRIKKIFNKYFFLEVYEGEYFVKRAVRCVCMYHLYGRFRIEGNHISFLQQARSHDTPDEETLKQMQILSVFHELGYSITTFTKQEEYGILSEFKDGSADTIDYLTTGNVKYKGSEDVIADYSEDHWEDLD